jgi:hypothetical protein
MNADDIKAQQQLDLDLKRQLGRPFVSNGRTYAVNELRMLQVAMVGGTLMCDGEWVAHTADEGKAVLAEFVARRTSLETQTMDAKTAAVAESQRLTLSEAL